jgi:uncharacterized protein (DUF2141 family)
MPARNVLIIALLVATAPPTICAQLADVTIRVVGAETREGTVEVSLFDSAESFMREPYLQLSGAVAEDGAYEATFTALPAGEYAAVAVHDENDNGKLDNGLLGFGGERFGFSNGVRPMLGWPDFEAAAFSVIDDTRIVIELD